MAASSGSAAGCGQTGAAFGYGAAVVGMVALDAFSFGRGSFAAKPIGRGSHIVYQGVDKAGVVRYVGITERGVVTRSAEHIASGQGKEKLIYSAINGAENLTKQQARIWEQELINQYGLGKNGGQLLNRINSISPKYWNNYGIAP